MVGELMEAGVEGEQPKGFFFVIRFELYDVRFKTRKKEKEENDLDLRERKQKRNRKREHEREREID